MTWQERNKEVLKRMPEDLSLRNLAAATIELYTYHVRRFGEFIGQSLDDGTPEQIRSFQLHLINVKKASWSAFNQTVCGLRFLYRITLPRPWGVSMIPFGKRPKQLPAVLGPGEVDKLLQCVPSIKHRTLLLTLYAAGLRLGEATALTISDIDSERMMLRIACGKGNKERLVPMSPRLLAALREYWRHVRSTQYLFPGLTFESRLNATTIQKTCRFAAVKAGLAKHVTPHTLRHSYATGLLEAGVDLTGGPISDRRLISHEQGQVTFWARAGVKAGGDRNDRRPVTLPGPEFVRLWSLHILPKGFVKTRRFGGYSNRQRQQFLQAYQELAPAVAPGDPPETTDPATPADGPETELTELSCPQCGARMNCIASQCRDAWSIIMADVHRPRWYLDGS